MWGETFTLFRLNLRNAVSRPFLPAIVIVGFFAVVLVLVSVLSIGRGLGRAFSRADATDVALVMSNGAFGESRSHLDEASVHALASEPGVAQSANGPLISPEALTTVIVPKRGSGIDSNVVLRGVTDTAFKVHRKVHIIAGRAFKTGVNEVIVGRQTAREYQNLEIGDSVHIGNGDWKIVGIFAADGNLRESEIWADARRVQDAVHMGNAYSDAWVKLTAPAAFKTFEATVKKDPQLNVQAKTEKDFYADLAQGTTSIISVVGYAIGLLMALGAVIGAINLLYTNLAARLGEMATLRAVGYRRFPVLAATQLEALTFALIGGILGGGIAYVVFNGYQAGTLAGGLQQVAFQFAVTPGLLLGGIVFALVMGFFGGLFPAIRAARLPITKALREA
ncbi:MAG TPA: ABC transporter permease [Gammaproteobacteria bacterium]|nr:ABC transporter permease [Gammaproteobacteria bacterium]